MNSYIKDTKYAALKLIELISKEEKELGDLNSDYEKAKRESRRRYFEFIRSEMNIDNNMIDTHLRNKYGEFYNFEYNVVGPLQQIN